jgi:hypothetical protein
VPKPTQFSSVSAVDAEGLVALVNLPDGRVEDKTVRAQFGCGYSINAFVVFVALSVIFVLAVFFRTPEVGSDCGSDRIIN